MALAANAVAVWGVWKLGWSGSTLLALYWLETLLGSLLVLARMAIHRSITHKRGYRRAQLGVRVNDAPVKNFVAEFAIGSLLFSFAHGILLAVFLGAFGERAGGPIDWIQLRNGGLGILVALGAGFAFDLVGIADRPFRWIREIAQLGLGRVVLLHLVLIGGAFGVMVLGQAAVPFLLFALLKTLADVGGAWPRRRPDPAEEVATPGWLEWMGERMKRSQPDLVKNVQRDLAKQRDEAARDEETDR